nr:type I restriction endonuclease subunit R [Desulfatiglans anilini]
MAKAPENFAETVKEHLPHEPRWPNVGEKLIAQDRRIYVSTYPTMLNIIRDESQQLSPHFFDFIVVDESHRSIYNTYKEVLDYFKTITLGLTATPTDIIDHNTFQLFHCEDGLPTFAYTFEEAVNNVPGYLCSFQVMKIQTRFQMEGISKRTISLEDQKKLLLEGKELEEINFEGSQLEKQVINKGTNALIVKEFMEECIKDGSGVLPGKTIFFCSSKAHARRIEEIFDKLFPQYKGELAELLHAEHPQITEDLLRQVYKNRKARFIQFIRHILGIEILKSFPETVSEAFDQFIGQHTNLSSRQLEFLNLLKGFIIEREKIEKKDLINAPFTVIHPQGIRGVFSPAEINEILQLTERLAA